MLSLAMKSKRVQFRACNSAAVVMPRAQYSTRFKTLEFQHPNLGFDPSLLADKEFVHDHPERPASEFIKQIPPIVVEDRVTYCDGREGGEGVFGHPRVYINCDKSRVDDPVSCDYCGKRFVQRKYIPKDHPMLKGYVIPEGAHHH